MERLSNEKFSELIKSAETESIYVLTNKDAELLHSFTSLPGNRPIKKERIQDIKKAFINGEFIPPIIVSVPHRFITEGNHRYAAAMECLNEDIPFKILVYLYKDTTALETARVINNTQKRWSANDRLNSYCFEKKPSYIKLKEFMDKYPDQFKKNSTYSISSALCLLAVDRSRNSMENTFYTGNLSIKDKHVEFAETIMPELLLISEILGTSAVFSRDHSTGWIKARTRLGIPFTEFIKRLKQKKGKWVQPTDTAKAWFDMYISIAGGF